MPQTNSVLGSYTMTMNGMTSTVAHNFAKDTTVLTATKKLSSGQVIPLNVLGRLRHGCQALRRGSILFQWSSGWP